MNLPKLRRLLEKRGGELAPLGDEQVDELARLHHNPSFGVDFTMEFCPAVREYLAHLLTRNGVAASDIRLHNHQLLVEESRDLSPGFYLFPYSYIVIGSSIGGNAICLHGPTGAAFWADHASFLEGLISYHDRRTGEWIELYEYTEENVRRALVLLDENLERFLKNLLRNKLTRRLDELD